MILICESGATKADWRAICPADGSCAAQCLTPGINVSTMSEDAVRGIISEAASRLPEGPYDSLHIYTAGVITPPIEDFLGACLRDGFGKDARIEILSDLVASARAACGRVPGIAAIMGTGANSCLWDGEKIVKKVNSGGFILGDEGSASALGKLFVADYIKGLVPSEVAADFESRFPHSYPEIVELVYHNSASPSAWLGSLAPFILSHYGNPCIREMADSNIRAFARRVLRQYDTGAYCVNVVGGFGFALKDIVERIFREEGITVGRFVSSPTDELVKFHCTNI